MTTSDDRLAKSEFLFDFSWKSYELVLNRNEHLDTKIHNTIVITGTMIPILLGLFYFLFEKLNLTESPYLPWVLAPIAVGMLFFLLATVAGMMSYAPRQFEMVGTEEFVSRHGAKDRLLVSKQLVSNLAHATAFNRVVVLEKAHRVGVMLAFLTIGAGFFFATFLIIAVCLLTGHVQTA